MTTKRSKWLNTITLIWFVALALLFVMIGTANATLIVTWSFNDPFQIVSPTATISMFATATNNSDAMDTLQLQLNQDPGGLPGGTLFNSPAP